MPQKLPDGMTQIIPYLFYQDVPAAMRWLAKAFGFEKILEHGTHTDGVHGEMRFGAGVIMLGSAREQYGSKSPRDIAGVVSGVFVYVDDVDAHCARAKAAGAEIVHDLSDQPYGRTYWARDAEKHNWFFTRPPA
jgi:PhnB protein